VEPTFHGVHIGVSEQRFRMVEGLRLRRPLRRRTVGRHFGEGHVAARRRGGK
jgi:hypothetical protein